MPIQGSPYALRALPGPLSPPHCTLEHIAAATTTAHATTAYAGGGGGGGGGGGAGRAAAARRVCAGEVFEPHLEPYA